MCDKSCDTPFLGYPYPLQNSTILMKLLDYTFETQLKHLFFLLNFDNSEFLIYQTYLFTCY